jgi:hypothetical protein
VRSLLIPLRTERQKVTDTGNYLQCAQVLCATASNRFSTATAVDTRGIQGYIVIVVITVTIGSHLALTRNESWISLTAESATFRLRYVPLGTGNTYPKGCYFAGRNKLTLANISSETRTKTLNSRASLFDIVIVAFNNIEGCVRVT